MKEIILYRRDACHLFSKVDDEMYEICKMYRWYSVKIKNVIYVVRKDPKTVYMHRFIMEKHLNRKLDSSEEIDHIDNDGLNNQLSNLRLATRSQNMANQRHHDDSKSNFIGVHYDSRYPHPYRAKIMVNYKNIHVKRGFDTPEEAAEYRDLLAIKHFGSAAKLNFEKKRQEYTQAITDGFNPEGNTRQFSSKFIGVSYATRSKIWTATIYVDGEQIYLGSFKTEEDANNFRLKKCEELGIDPNKARIKK